MIKDEYSPYKIIHHQKKLDYLKAGHQVTPLHVQIVPTNVCNHNCSFCAYRMDEYLSNEKFDVRNSLSYKKIIETLDSCVALGVRSVQYTGGGEPLVHPRIHEVFERTFTHGLDMGLVTNGMALNEDLCKILADASWVRVSIDAATPETYGSIRRIQPKKLDVVKKNIENLLKYRKETVIGIGFVVSKENWKEIFQAATMAKNLGVDNFRISVAYTPGGYGYFEEFEESAKYLAQDAETLTDDKFTVFNLFNEKIKDSFESVQDYDRCCVKDLIAYVGADYNVYSCCTLAYNQKGLIGSIKDQTFAQVWLSDKKFRKYENHNPRIHCQFPCMYKEKNQFINYCIKYNPRHVNFI